MVYSKIIGLGSYAPLQIIENDELSKIVETSNEWITTRTGIKERRISSGEKTYQMAVRAAKEAIENAAIEKEMIDMIILATITPDYFTPSTANFVQAELGLKDIPSFDVSAGCTGFIYGLQIADQFIKSKQSKTILVIGVEALSKITDWSDRNTCVLFGDGAGAAILQSSDQEGIICTYTGSQGDLQEFLTIPAVPLKNPFLSHQDNNGRYSIISMNGKEIFKFATRIMIKSISHVLNESNLSMDNIDYIIPHQANIRIIDYVSQKLKVEREKFIINLDRFGNTSAASVPLAMNEAYRKNIFNQGDKIIMVAFGGGLTWGAVLVNWTI
ncbi:MAG: beta-ketoacyl-ACP synthase III [Candidatus Caldatribacteriota bacterium]|nr:beta-ketoacyl-ACP synthase III [Candidatus Caldatribacteriota bacterium]